MRPPSPFHLLLQNGGVRGKVLQHLHVNSLGSGGAVLLQHRDDAAVPTLCRTALRNLQSRLAALRLVQTNIAKQRRYVVTTSILCSVGGKILGKCANIKNTATTCIIVYQLKGNK